MKFSQNSTEAALSSSLTKVLRRQTNKSNIYTFNPNLLIVPIKNTQYFE